MKNKFIFVISISCILFLTNAVIAAIEDNSKQEWNETYRRIDKLSDEEIKTFLQSQNENEIKAAKLILKIRTLRKDWEVYTKRIENYSYEKLILTLSSTNSTEVAVAISKLTIRHKDKRNELIPLFVQYANKHTKHKTKSDDQCPYACMSFIMAVEDLSNQNFYTRYDGPTISYSLSLLNDWWKKSKP